MVEASPTGFKIQCDCIRVNGQECEREFRGTWPLIDPDKPSNPMPPRTATTRKALARRLARSDGWRVTLGSDECARVHGFVPVPEKVKR